MFLLREQSLMVMSVKNKKLQNKRFSSTILIKLIIY